MENLKNYGTQELSINEINETEGGIAPIVILGIGIAIGLAFEWYVH